MTMNSQDKIAAAVIAYAQENPRHFNPERLCSKATSILEVSGNSGTMEIATAARGVWKYHPHLLRRQILNLEGEFIEIFPEFYQMVRSFGVNWYVPDAYLRMLMLDELLGCHGVVSRETSRGTFLWLDLGDPTLPTLICNVATDTLRFRAPETYLSSFEE